MVRLFFVLLLSLSMALPTSGVWAAGEAISVTDSQLSLDAELDGWALRADVQIELTPRLEETINRGIPIYFQLEFDLERPRWYWWDEKAVSARLPIRLVYNTLAREYRVGSGGLQQRYARLQDALAAIGQVRRWVVADRGALQPGHRYDAVVRMRIDLSQMPRPLQVNALTSRDWLPASEPRHFRVDVSER